MENTINPNCSEIVANAWPGNRPTSGFFEWVTTLVEQFPYPEIRPGDNRIAEYIPPRQGPGRN